MKKLTKWTLTILFYSSIGYSQTLQLSKSKDTTVCFSVNQSKFLLRQVTLAQEYLKINNVLKERIYNFYDIIRQDSLNRLDLSTLNNNNNEIINLQKKQIISLNTEINNKNNTILRQKVYKWLAIIGAVGVGYLGYRVGNLK